MSIVNTSSNQIQPGPSVKRCEGEEKSMGPDWTQKLTPSRFAFCYRWRKNQLNQSPACFGGSKFPSCLGFCLSSLRFPQDRADLADRAAC